MPQPPGAWPCGTDHACGAWSCPVLRICGVAIVSGGAIPCSLRDWACWRCASCLLRYWMIALAPRPLMRMTLCPSVAAMSVFTPRSTPITVCCGGARRDLTDEAHDAIGQPDFHEAPRQSDGLWQANAQRAALAVGQDEAPVANAGVLVGVDHIAIAPQAPRIARLRLAVLAQLPARLHRLAELADDLLGDCAERPG